MKALVIGVLIVWFLVILASSYLGILEDHPSYPSPIPAVIAVILVAYGTWYRRSPAFRNFVLTLDLRYITWFQTLRGAGVFIIPLAHYPSAFSRATFPLDLFFGVTSPMMAMRLNREPLPRMMAIAWNLLGLAHFVIVIVFRVLTSRTPWGYLADASASTIALSQFPLIFVTTYFAPLLIIGNIIALQQLRRPAANDEPIGARASR